MQNMSVTYALVFTPVIETCSNCGLCSNTATKHQSEVSGLGRWEFNPCFSTPGIFIKLVGCLLKIQTFQKTKKTFWQRTKNCYQSGAQWQKHSFLLRLLLFSLSNVSGDLVAKLSSGVLGSINNVIPNFWQPVH